MKRRHLLARAGAGSIATAVGCLGSADPSDEPRDRDPNAGGTEGDDGDGEPAVPAIDGQPCPPFETVRDRAVCSHTANADAAPVALEPSTERAVLADGRPAEEISLTLTNRSAHPITVNPYSWTVRVDSGSGWTAFWREYTADSHRTIAPFEAHSWSFTDVVESVRREPVLEPGRYAAELGVPDPGSDREWIGCIALVALEAAE